MKYNIMLDFKEKLFSEMLCGELFLDENESPAMKIKETRNIKTEETYNYVKLYCGELGYIDKDDTVIIFEYTFETQTINRISG